MYEVKMKLTEIEPGLLLIKFKTRYEAAATFMRMSEFCESPMPDIRGQIFTLEYFMDAYARKYGKFNYTQKWVGFNIPGEQAKQFFNNFDLLRKERALFDLIEDWMGRDKPFYLIGTSQGKRTVNHEIAHGLYALYPAYREGMQRLLQEQSAQDRLAMNKFLRKDYAPLVWEDESQAYFATDSRPEFKKAFGKRGSDMYDRAEGFREFFRTFKP